MARGAAPNGNALSLISWGRGLCSRSFAKKFAKKFAETFAKT
jgi:hypothetical protein